MCVGLWSCRPCSSDWASGNRNQAKRKALNLQGALVLISNVRVKVEKKVGMLGDFFKETTPKTALCASESFSIFI